MKRCFKCEKVLPLDAFYAHPAMADGKLGKCKECTRADVRQNRARRRSYYAAYDRERYITDEKRRTRLIEYARTPTGKESHRKALQAQYLNHPEKARARRVFGNAVRDGKLERQPCAVCGNQKSQGHHEDYSRPLEVIWLCSRHHAERHQSRAA